MNIDFIGVTFKFRRIKIIPFYLKIFFFIPRKSQNQPNLEASDTFFKAQVKSNE